MELVRVSLRSLRRDDRGMTPMASPVSTLKRDWDFARAWFATPNLLYTIHLASCQNPNNQPARHLPGKVIGITAPEERRSFSNTRRTCSAIRLKTCRRSLTRNCSRHRPRLLNAHNTELCCGDTWTLLKPSTPCCVNITKVSRTATIWIRW
jgi:hypothetical protein